MGGRKDKEKDSTGPLMSPNSSLTTLPTVPEASSAPEQTSNGGDPVPEAAAAAEPAEEDNQVCAGGHGPQRRGTRRPESGEYFLLRV